jgi:rhodanese-related sulfurtransferase
MTTTSPAVIDAARLRDLLDSAMPPRLIDVRTPAEFETVHIPGAPPTARHR